MDSIHLEKKDLPFLPNFSMHRFKSLYLYNNRIRILFEDYLPQGIELLDCGENYIHSDGLPSVWPDTIKELYLDYNCIYDTDGITWPDNLELLRIGHNPLFLFPEMLPPNLKILQCNHTPLKEIPYLPINLKVLYARACCIVRLPSILPSTLVSIDLASNHLRSEDLPKAWPETLETLDLTSNYLDTFPTGLPTYLFWLSLSHNKIKTLSDTLPEYLQTLFISNNGLLTLDWKKRTLPLLLADITYNSLLKVPVEGRNDAWACHILSEYNWDKPIYSIVVKRFQNLWRRYRLCQILRCRARMSKVKDELLAVAMCPERVGHFESIPVFS
jgi:hypothetical protein